MVNDKEGGSLGSDGETSDYQRSTPSPQDSNARITELSEGNNTNSETTTSSSISALLDVD